MNRIIMTLCDNKEKSTDHKAYDKTNKLIDQVNLIVEVRKGFSDNINKICILMSELQDGMYSDVSWLRLVEMNKINPLLDKSLDFIWKMIYGKNREENEINNIDIDKDKDIDGYVTKYTDIANDKSELVNKIGEGIVPWLTLRVADNNIAAKNLKKWKDDILNSLVSMYMLNRILKSINVNR